MTDRLEVSACDISLCSAIQHMCVLDKISTLVDAKYNLLYSVHFDSQKITLGHLFVLKILHESLHVNIVIEMTWHYMVFTQTSCTLLRVPCVLCFHVDLAARCCVHPSSHPLADPQQRGRAAEDQGGREKGQQFAQMMLWITHTYINAHT